MIHTEKKLLFLFFLRAVYKIAKLGENESFSGFSEPLKQVSNDKPQIESWQQQITRKDFSLPYTTLFTG